MPLWWPRRWMSCVSVAASVADRTLVAPVWSTLLDYHDTLGGDVGELAAMADFAPDPEQQLFLDQLFAVDRHGKPVAFESAVIAPRQNLKSGALEMAALGWLFLTQEPLVTWSAHEFKTTMESFRHLTQLVEGCDFLRREVKWIHRGVGSESIELTNNRRLLFKARTKGSGRGLTGNKTILDEAFALRPMHMGAILPTMAATPNGQTAYGSSAGMVDSDVLRGIRDRGRNGTGGRLAYVEWGDPQPNVCQAEDCGHELSAVGCALDDMDRLARVNTALDRRITRDTLRALRQAMPPEEFAREFLGWWDERATTDSDLSAADWSALAGSAGPSGRLVMAVDVAPSQAWSSIVACGNGVIELVDRRRGTSWLPERMADLAERHNVDTFAVDPVGPVGGVLPELERAGLPLALVDGKESVRACGALVAAVADKSLSHRGEPEFLAAVGGSSRRSVGDGWKWSRRDSTVDISPLVAATLAHWLWLSRAGEPITPEIYFV